MALSAIAGLIDRLRGLHLLEDAQIDKLKQLQARFPDKQALIKKLLEHRWITPFQANVVAAGKGEHLLLGSYVLLERLGEGGMGEVFKARNWKLGRIVALKVIRKDKALSQNAMRRFQREVRGRVAAAASEHRAGARRRRGERPALTWSWNTSMASTWPSWSARTGSAAGRGGLRLHPPGRLWPAARPRAGHGAPRHQAQQPAASPSADGTVKILDMGLARMNEPKPSTTRPAP